MENTLDGIEAIPEQFPRTSKKVPDINFYYRCRFQICKKTPKKNPPQIGPNSVLTFVNVLFRSVEAMSSCPLGRSTVVTLRCNPEKSTGGDLSVPRYHSPGLTITEGLSPHLSVQSCSTQQDSGPVKVLRILWVVLARRKSSKHFVHYFALFHSSNHRHACLLLCTLAGMVACCVYESHMRIRESH